MDGSDNSGGEDLLRRICGAKRTLPSSQPQEIHTVHLGVGYRAGQEEFKSRQGQAASPRLVDSYSAPHRRSRARALPDSVPETENQEEIKYESTNQSIHAREDGVRIMAKRTVRVHVYTQIRKGKRIRVSPHIRKMPKKR